MKILISDTAHIAVRKKPICNHPRLQKIKVIVKQFDDEILCGNCVLKAYKHGLLVITPKE